MKHVKNATVDKAQIKGKIIFDEVYEVYRVEDKYNCSEQELLVLQARLGAVLWTDRNQPDSNGYMITSVYFDDYADSHLREVQEGNQVRQKFRLRIYNRSFDVIKLEVKRKKYNRILKLSSCITKIQMHQLLRGECIEDAAPSEESAVTLFNIAIMERGIRPKIIVEYDRTAYIYEPGNVRITIDRNLRGSSDIGAFRKQDWRAYPLIYEGGQILEVKYDEFLPGFIAGLLELGNLNQTSNSKYRICREYVGGRYNVF